ncbi:hypothetical protein ENSA5_03120 [Enhygromyxa salina]|uniref:Uncharacterized protein n=1 Tax=Enhygromyxa salina TaxID=215803 RepID=A0A2S9YJV8_9BACT|nr:hypothetical protein [Enhygromyxa salina]PRQ05322.1 hypothetical protein ENSA5_03120 [Enhygromyxa salina]
MIGIEGDDACFTLDMERVELRVRADLGAAVGAAAVGVKLQLQSGDAAW